MILFVVVGILLCVLLTALLTIKTMLLSFAITAPIVGLVAWLWRVPSEAGKKRKKQILLWGFLGSQLFVLGFAVNNAKNTLFPDRSSYREKSAEITAIFNNVGIENKFERGFSIAASAKKDWEKRDLRRDVVQAFMYSQPDNHFSAADLAIAQMEYEEEQKRQGNSELNPCKADNPGFYTRIVVHRDGPASLMTFLEAYYNERPACQEFSKLRYFVLERCKGIWLWRCKRELSRERLLPFVAEPTPAVIASELSQFIHEIFDK